MLEFLEGKTSDRKLRLFASGCCRRLSAHFKKECSLQMVDVSEQYADSVLAADALEAAFIKAAGVCEELYREGDAVALNSAAAVCGLGEELSLSQVFAGAAEAARAVAAPKE